MMMKTNGLAACCMHDDDDVENVTCMRDDDDYVENGENEKICLIPCSRSIHFQNIVDKPS